MASALNLVRPRISGARSGCYTCRSCLDAGLFQPPLARRQRAAQRRFATKKESVAILRHYKSQKYQDKILAAQERWDARAKKVKSGEVESTWDMLVKRGLVKDVTGYVCAGPWLTPRLYICLYVLVSLTRNGHICLTQIA